MGAPDSGLQAAELPAAETLLTAFRTIGAAERRKHASVLNYWLSIRGDKEFPPLHDFDPLEISDFGQSSVLLELIGGGHDAEIRHLGEALKGDGTVERIIDAPSPSVLASITKKLPIVAISRDFLAFEDAYGSTRCWVTLLPLSGSGAWVDYVYAFVSVETAPVQAAEPVQTPPEDAQAEDVLADQVEDIPDAPADNLEANDLEAGADVVPTEAEQPDQVFEEEPVEAVQANEEPVEAVQSSEEPVEALQASDEPEPEEPAESATAKSGPGFAKLFEGFASLTGFYGQGVQVEPLADAEPLPSEPASEPLAIEPPATEPLAVEPVAIEPVAVEQPAAEPLAIEQPANEPADEPAPASEGTLQSKLAEVRAKADEARAAKLRANLALYEGLGAAYDFALDAEDSPEEYLRLVEAQGLKIQLRAPMAPVVKLAFDGLCDDSIVAQLGAVLAWALEHQLPRGTLADRINEAGGIASILSGEAQPA